MEQQKLFHKSHTATAIVFYLEDCSLALTFVYARSWTAPIIKKFTC